jgi:hypothetical protein
MAHQTLAHRTPHMTPHVPPLAREMRGPQAHERRELRRCHELLAHEVLEVHLRDL